MAMVVACLPSGELLMENIEDLWRLKSFQRNEFMICEEEISEVKDDVLDLTVHCEPTLVEDDYGNEESSILLDEEGVDPLEYLEVDQESGSESIDEDEISPEYTEANCSYLSNKLKNLETTDILIPDYPFLQKNGCQSANKIEHVKEKQTNNKQVDNHVDEISPNKCQECGCFKDQQIDKIMTVNDYMNINLCVCNGEKVLCKKLDESECYDQISGPEQTENYKCKICGKVFKFQEHLKIHSSLHSKEKSLICDTCNKPFKLLKSLKQHRPVCKKKRVGYRCVECGELTMTKRAFFTHIKTHEKPQEEISLTCEICCIEFDCSSSKKLHIMEVHVAAQRFVCQTCGEAFVTESAMKRHAVTHERSYPCTTCDAVFPVKHALIRHRIQHQKELRCRTCGREFEQITAYTDHKLEHNCGKDFMCELCNKMFKDKPSLRKHLSVHVPISERSVICDMCNRSVCGIAALRRHKRLYHGNSRPYTCEFCSKSFNQLCKLKYHIVIHASDKPVSCDICNKAFGNEKDIKIHMRTHTGERPFKCDLCGKTFRQRGHVKTHQVVHTKERPYSCQECGKTFGLPSSLKKHMKLHTTVIG